MKENAGPRVTGDRAASSATWAATGIVVLVGGILTLRRLHDYDLLWHVVTGRWILAHRVIPHEDPFGAITAGAPWIDVAWAAQVVMALLENAGGLVRLHLIAAGVVSGTLVFLLARARLAPWVAISALAFVLTVWFRFLVRPDLLTFPLTVALIFLVARLPTEPRATLPLLAALTVLWVNLHGSFVLVPVVLAAAAAGSLVAPQSRRDFPLYAGGCLLTLGASLLNPYGPRVFELFVPYVRSSLAVLGASPPAGQLAIAEWKPTWQALTEPPYSPFWLLALVLLAMASFALRGRRVSLPLVSSAIVLGVLGMLAIRHLLPFAAALVAMIVINDRERRREADVDGEAPVERILDSVVGRIAVSTLVVILGGGLLFSVLTDGFYVGRDLPYRTGVGFDPALVPEGAVRWLATRDSPENVFNNFDSGAYLLYRLYPRYLPYDDARVVDPEHFERTRRAVEDPLAFDRMVTDDAIGTVVLVHPSPESVTLLPRLERDPRWRLVFRDHNSTVHVRTDLPEPSAVRNPPSLPPTEEPLGRAIDGALAHLKLAELPAAELTDAFVSGLLGDIERERQAYVRARSIAPGNRRVRAYFGDDSRM